MANLIEKSLQPFVRSLAQATISQDTITEDTVRHLFMDALSPYIVTTDVHLEYPHPSLPRNKVDVYISPQKLCSAMVLEFKIHQKTPSGKNQPKTQKAGQLLGDVFRLVSFQPFEQEVRRYLVYVTDREMAVYFQNPANRLKRFFSLGPGEAMNIAGAEIEKHPPTFRKHAGHETPDCRVTNRLNECIEDRIWVRVYEVELDSALHGEG